MTEITQTDLTAATAAAKAIGLETVPDALVRSFAQARADALREAAADPAVVERVARALCPGRGVNPDSLFQHEPWERWDDDERREYADAVTGEPRVQLFHRAWRQRVADAKAALAALIGDQARDKGAV